MTVLIKHLSVILPLFLVFSANAATWSSRQESVWDTRAQTWITPDEMAAQIRAQEIWVMGEQHSTTDTLTDPENIVHHNNQTRLLNSLNQTGLNAKNSFSVSLGMEFLSYPDQPSVDLYLQGQINEQDFLKAVHWGGNPFESYRAQILLPATYGARTWALNISPSIASHIAKLGPDGLTDEEKSMLPPRFELGNPQYFARFKEIMGDHAPEDKITNYFWAQSLWDSTMAWKATQTVRASNQALMIIVGEFHAIYGGGLPEMITRYPGTKVRTVIQTSVDSWTSETLKQAILPDATYGAQSDFIWVHLNQFNCEGDDCPQASLKFR